MPRQASVRVENNFVRGLVTEATALNFPENAATDCLNCVFDQRGKVVRRQGFEFEEGYDVFDFDREQSVIRGFLWKDVLGDGTLTFLVVQLGNNLKFYNVSDAVDGAISPEINSNTIDLTSFSPAGADEPSINACEFAEGLGYLFVTHPNLEPFYLSYDLPTNTFTSTQITVQVRDFEGVDDGLDIDERPTGTYASQSADYKYNMDNQGWYFESRAAMTAWDTARTDLPSSSDIWWFFKDASDNFDTTLIPKRVLGNTAAPKGHFILNVFDKDRNAASGISGITGDPVTTGTARFPINAFFAGRVWYSGLQAAGNASKLYFSQVIENPQQIGRCYQSNDPTSESTFDLLDNDGGVIQIADAGNIIKMFPLQGALLIFSSNGVWSVSGTTNSFGQSAGFKATDFVVSKISSVAALSATSFVDVDGFPVWWNSDGIYRISEGQSGKFEVVSLTDDSIKTFYQDIPLLSKLTARGAYDYVNKIIHWIYRSEGESEVEAANNYDSVLTFNRITRAFSPWQLSLATDTQINDIFITNVSTSSTVSVLVEDSGGDQVQDSGGEDVIVFERGSTLIVPDFKYLCTFPASGSNHSLTIAEVRDPTYQDWVTEEGGVDYSSFFKTGYVLEGQAQRYFQPNYVFVFMETEDTASCIMRGIFEFSSGQGSNKESTGQQIYNDSVTNRGTRYRKLKVRGKGRVLQLKFESLPSAPFTIVGWSMFLTQNTGV